MTLYIYQMVAVVLLILVIIAGPLGRGSGGWGYSHIKAVRVCAAVKPPFFDFY